VNDAELAERAAARVGTVLNEKWRLDALLGVGGMASVYAATHRNQKRAAVKLLHPGLSAEESIRQRFLREGYAANTVAHPGAVRVDDDDILEDGSAFLVMELLTGETLQARWERKGRRIDVRDVLAYADQLLDVLAAAHDKGIVHRDVKPDNLFVTSDGVLKVLDFGIAGLVDVAEGDSRATRMGSVMGTPAFMPPEQARARWELVDAQTDLWAVGATLFTLLTGEFVHGDGTGNELLARAITEHARAIGSVRADLPAPVAALVDKALAYDKADRWPDARAMQAAVREAHRALAGGGVMRVPTPTIFERCAAAEPATPSAELGAATTAHAVASERTRTRASANRLGVMMSVAALLGAATLAVAATRRSAPTPAQAGAPETTDSAVVAQPSASIAPPEPTPAASPAPAPVAPASAAPSGSTARSGRAAPPRSTARPTSGAAKGQNPFDRRK
jgi:serine/threonine-protein kinase